jgi:hypothetical protein
VLLVGAWMWRSLTSLKRKESSLLSVRGAQA